MPEPPQKGQKPAKRRILAADVHRIALCKRGKNGLTTLLKSEDSARATLVKAVEGDLLVVVTVPEWVDADGDTQAEDVIREMVASHIANGGQLDLEHDGKVLTPEQARTMEEFIIQPGDARFEGWTTYQGEQIDPTGGWGARIQIDDPEIQELFVSEGWDGVSLYGPAAVKQLTIKAASTRVAEGMGADGSDPNDYDMKPEELQAVLEAVLGNKKAPEQDLKTLVKSAVADALAAPENTPAGETKDIQDDAPKPPTFSGDASNPDDLEAHANAVRTFELNQRLAKGEITPDELADLAKSMRTAGPDEAELREAGLIGDEPSDKELKLARELFEVKRDQVEAAGAPANLKKSAKPEKTLAEVVNDVRAGRSTAARKFRVV